MSEPTHTITPQPEPVKKVYAAICGVIADISKTGISKDQTNSHQRYKFRGIDDVYNALAPLLAKHHLCIIPEITKRDESEVPTRNGKSLRVLLTVEYTLVCALDGSKHLAVVHGEAMDSSDKAVNKAFTAAWKYLCFQLFAIPTEGNQDADASSPEMAAQPKKHPNDQLATVWAKAKSIDSKRALETLLQVTGLQTMTGLHEVPSNKVDDAIIALDVMK